MTLAFNWPRESSSEMKIPRRSDTSFWEKFPDRQPGASIEHLYRCDLLESSQGLITETTGVFGHRYVNPLDNVLSLLRIYNQPAENLPPVASIISYVTELNAKGRKALGIYYFSTELGAAMMQMNNLENSRQLVGLGGVVTGEFPDEFIRNVSILSRVKVGDLPKGVCFADPIPQDSKDGIVHVVDAESVSINLGKIEFRVAGTWVQGTEVLFEEVIETARNGSVSHLVPAFVFAMAGENANNTGYY
ncbi:hypothetical protein [Devosia sp.]|uniref:hypothetical protein n=1 Tax=Devosia sp. TaxID=1871048 RepID=UPI002FC74EB8